MGRGSGENLLLGRSSHSSSFTPNWMITHIPRDLHKQIDFLATRPNEAWEVLKTHAHTSSPALQSLLEKMSLSLARTVAENQEAAHLASWVEGHIREHLSEDSLEVSVEDLKLGCVLAPVLGPVGKKRAEAITLDDVVSCPDLAIKWGRGDLDDIATNRVVFVVTRFLNERLGEAYVAADLATKRSALVVQDEDEILHVIDPATRSSTQPLPKTTVERGTLCGRIQGRGSIVGEWGAKQRCPDCSKKLMRWRSTANSMWRDITNGAYYMKNDQRAKEMVNAIATTRSSLMLQAVRQRGLQMSDLEEAITGDVINDAVAADLQERFSSLSNKDAHSIATLLPHHTKQCMEMLQKLESVV